MFNAHLGGRHPALAVRLAPGLLATPLLIAAGGQPVELERIGLGEAILRAEKAHPDLALPLARIEGARADVEVARAGRYPGGELRSIFGLVNGARVGEVPDGLPSELAPLFSEDRADDPFNDIGPFSQNSLRITQPLYTFGKIDQGVAAAEAGLAARRAALEEERARIRLEVTQTYYGYQLAAQLTTTFREVEENFREAVTQAEARLDEAEGRVTQADVLELRIAANQIRRRVFELERQAQVSLLAFRRALGEPLDAPLAPAEDRIRPVEIGGLLDLESLEARALTGPAWRAALLGLEARQQAVLATERLLFPDFFLGVQIDVNWAGNRDDLQNPFLVDRFNLLQGGPFFGLIWNLDFATELAELTKARAQAAEERARLEQARSGLPLKARRAHAKLVEATKSLKTARESRKAGRALSFLTTTNFRLGIGGAEVILRAYGLYARTLGEYYQAVFELNVAAAELREAVGRPIAVSDDSASPR